MTGRTIFKKMGGGIYLVSNLVSMLPLCIRRNLFVFFRGTHGNKGIFIRYILFRNLVKKCGDNVVIKENVYIYNPENIVCGDNISIHEMCYINACGGLKIGNNVSIAHSSSILTFNHKYDNHNIPIKYNPIETLPITICDDVWIGCGCRILAGVTINSRCIVAAGAVVTKNTINNSLVGGVPAKVLKTI